MQGKVDLGNGLLVPHRARKIVIVFHLELFNSDEEINRPRTELRRARGRVEEGRGWRGQDRAEAGGGKGEAGSSAGQKDPRKVSGSLKRSDEDE